MHALRKEDLPFIGSSYNFVGAEHGDVGISIFFVEALAGRGAALHMHEYDEVILLEEGHSRLVIENKIHEAQAGEIIVIKAHTPHGFINPGPGVLKQFDIHLSPRFRQELVPPTAISRDAGLPES